VPLRLNLLCLPRRDKGSRPDSAALIGLRVRFYLRALVLVGAGANFLALCVLENGFKNEVKEVSMDV
jgi:hypothetical protein